MMHFNTLSKQDQQNLLLKQGTFLAERTDGPFRIMLYQLDNLYVEVYFFNLYNKVAFLETFSDTDALEPYLQQMDLNHMLNGVLQ